ncbi:restriction endonuclease subunit S [Lentzea atacamensis]|uniref:restriction endonuclease subunit S n=1 Tax=Lentzea atacamensis TaxID=531938 RepID=UPI001B886C07
MLEIAPGENSHSNLNARKMKDYTIAVPSPQEQKRIVSILDRLDSLVNKIQSIFLLRLRPAERSMSTTVTSCSRLRSGWRE